MTKQVKATNWRLGQAFETGQWQVIGDFQGREVVVCVADGRDNAERIVEDFQFTAFMNTLKNMSLVELQQFVDSNPELSKRIIEKLKDYDGSLLGLQATI